MDDAPDFDDLMEDAMQEEFDDDPYDNDDTDLERMMLEAAEQQEQQTQQSPHAQPTKVPATMTMDDDDDDDDDEVSADPHQTFHHDAENSDDDDDASMASHDSSRHHHHGSPIRRPSTKKDAFSFERYAFENSYMLACSGHFPSLFTHQLVHSRLSMTDTRRVPSGDRNTWIRPNEPHCERRNGKRRDTPAMRTAVDRSFPCHPKYTC